VNFSTSSAPLLQVTGVTVRFGGLTAVDDVSFDVQQGDLLGLIGPNGAGKTTMMRAIIGVVQPTLGSVLLGGESLNGLPIHKRIQRGMSLSQQLVRPLRDISIEENVALTAASEKTISLCGPCSMSPPSESLPLPKLNWRVWVLQAWLRKVQVFSPWVFSNVWSWRVRLHSNPDCCCWMNPWLV